MVDVSISINVSGACLVRGEGGEEEYKVNPTLNDTLDITVADDSNLDIWVKSDGYEVYENSFSVTNGNIQHTEIVTLNEEELKPIRANPPREVDLQYDGINYGYIRYGYGLNDPNIAATVIDGLFKSKQGMQLIADYSKWNLDTSPENEPFAYPKSDIAVPGDDRIVAVEYHDDRIYLVGRKQDNTEHLYRYKFNSDNELELDDTWNVNPQPVTVVNQAEGMAIWNGHIYIAGKGSGNKSNGYDVHRLDNGNVIPNGFTIRFPAGFPTNTGYYPSGICLDEQRNRMILFFRNRSQTESILEIELRDIFTGELDTADFFIGDNQSNQTLFGAVDDDGVLYLGNGQSGVATWDMHTSLELQDGKWNTLDTFSDITIFRGVVLLAVPFGNNRGLRAYALRNRKTTTSAENPADRNDQVRHPGGGENPLTPMPYRITPDGISIDFDHIRIIPHPNTKDFQTRPLNAPILSRYGGIHLPHWTEMGRVQLCSVPFPIQDTGTLTDDTISAIAEKVKMELPTPVTISEQVWRTIFSPGLRDTPENQINTAAYFLQQAHDMIGANKTILDNTKVEIDKIKADTTLLKTNVSGIDTKSTEIDAIKTTTDKIIFNDQNHIRMDETTLTQEISTLTNIVGQARMALEGDIDNNKNILNSIQSTLGQTKTAVDNTKSTIDALTQASIAIAVWEHTKAAEIENSITEVDNKAIANNSILESNKEKLEESLKYVKNRHKVSISDGTETIYDNDGSTELQIFDLKDSNGQKITKTTDIVEAVPR